MNLSKLFGLLFHLTPRKYAGTPESMNNTPIPFSRGCLYKPRIASSMRSTNIATTIGRGTCNRCDYRLTNVIILKMVKQIVINDNAVITIKVNIFFYCLLPLQVVEALVFYSGGKGHNRLSRCRLIQLQILDTPVMLQPHQSTRI